MDMNAGYLKYFEYLVSIEVNKVKFSLDGRYLASCSKDNTIKLWNMSTFVCVVTFEGHTDSVYI